MCLCVKHPRTARRYSLRYMLRRMLLRWWQDEKMHWRVIWHVLRCNESCAVWGDFIYTGGSFDCSATRLTGYGRCRQRMVK